MAAADATACDHWRGRSTRVIRRASGVRGGGGKVGHGSRLFPVYLADLIAGQRTRLAGKGARLDRQFTLRRADGVSGFRDFEVNPRVAQFAVEAKLPSVSGWAPFALGGCLTYVPNVRDLYRSLARFVDRVLRGTKPADLPVEVPTRLELVLNLKTAKALGLTVPPTLLAAPTK